MKDAELERLKREDPKSAEIIALMLADNDRELSEFEALRIQQHVEQSPSLQEYLEGRAPETLGQDRIWDQIPVPTPTNDEWRQVDIGLNREIGRADAELFAARADSVEAGRGGVWQAVVGLAAALLFAFALVEQYSTPSTPSDPVDNFAEADEDEVIITELPDDALDVQIEDVEGALMIYVSSG